MKRVKPAVVAISIAVLVTGCASIKFQAQLEGAEAMTATALAEAHASATPVPQLGTVADVSGGDIWVKTLPSGPARRLTTGGHDLHPLWSPSGRWLAFVRQRKNLWVVRANGTGAHRIDTVDQHMESFAWSPVRDQLAYVSHGGLAVAGLHGHHRQLVAPPHYMGSGVQAIAWSPDGQWIAYDEMVRPTSKPPTLDGIWRVRINGSQRQKVYRSTNTAMNIVQLAAWSRDGKWILFWQGPLSASIAADGNALMAVRAKGGLPSSAAPAGGSTTTLLYRSYLAWSPEGHRLAVIIGGDRETWVSKMAAVVRIGHSLLYLSSSRLASVDPSWSPDGRSIAVAAEPPPSRPSALILPNIKNRRIWVFSANGSSRRRLTDNPFYEDEHPEWSADGRSILFARMHETHAELWLMNADGTGQRRVVSQLTPSPFDFNFYGHIPWEEFYDWRRG